MCGIAGRILGAPGRVGHDLVELMDAQEHRGADSTGFAVYGPPRDTGYVLRGMGFDKSRMDTDVDDFRTVLKAHGSDFLEDPTFVTDDAAHYCFRMLISDPVTGDITRDFGNEPIPFRSLTMAERSIDWPIFEVAVEDPCKNDPYLKKLDTCVDTTNVNATSRIGFYEASHVRYSRVVNDHISHLGWA